MMLALVNGKILVQGKPESRNILIKEGIIAKITPHPLNEGERIDLAGNVILPGLIDCHVHLRDPGDTYKEDFRTGTEAAAAGGVTTVLDMPNNKPPITTVNLLEEKRRLAKSKSAVNYGLYLGATKDNIEEVLKATNIPGVKLYMGSSTGNLLVDNKAAIRQLLDSGRLIVIHAENEQLIVANTKKMREEAGDKAEAAVHATLRDARVEATAVEEALSLAKSSKRARLHFTHISTAESVQLIREAKKTVEGVSCDTTPHHLFLTSEELKKQGNFAKMNPPLRSSQDVEALWQGLADGTINCIGTDHAPHTIAEKEQGYWEAPSGVPGLETMLPLLLNAAHSKRLSLQQVTELTSGNPARLFGIKNKGMIAEGYDADLVIVDLGLQQQVKNEELFTKCKWSPFNGWTLQGWPILTLINGQVVYQRGKRPENGKGKGKEAEFR